MSYRSSILFAFLIFSFTFVSGYGQQTIVVTPVETHGWTTADTRPGGTVTFVEDMTAPSGVGALNLKTDATTTAKAQYLHDANTPIASVTELGYWTKQNVGSPPIADPSYQLATCLGGTGAPTPPCNGFTTFVFEPYENVVQGPITPGAWQEWDVDMGFFWSTRSFMCSGGPIVAGAGGAPFYTLAQIKTICPNAVVVGFGVNIGTNNPMYDVETDLFDFNETTYDFEPFHVVRNKDECKDGGWRTVVREDGTHFKNQGECVSYANHNPES